MMCRDSVDVSVAGAGEPVAFLVAGGCLDRCGAVPRCEVRGGAEPGDVADVADEPGGPGRADPVELAQRAAGRGDELAQLLVGGPDFGVDDGQFIDELTGQLVAGLGHDAHRRRRGTQQVAGLGRG
jgi:hypothetical protein